MEQTQEVKEVTTLALSVPDQARQIIITDHASYSRAGEVIVYIKSLRKKITDTFKPIKQKIDAAKREVLDQEKEADRPLAEAEAYLTPMIIAWDREQERLRREEQRRLEEIARKQAEEQALLDAIAAEEAAKANGAAKEEAAQESAAIMDEPVYVAPVVIPKETPKVAGMSFRTNWTFRVTNPSLIPREYMSIDMVKIGGVVRAMKDQARIPGIEVIEEKTVAGRRAA